MGNTNNSGFVSLMQGSTGENVKRWQEFLKSQGYNVGNVDGIYGPQTVAMTKAWQGANGLTMDGIAGKDTISKSGITLSNTMGPSKVDSTNPYSNITPFDPKANFMYGNYTSTTEGIADKQAVADAIANVKNFGTNWEYADVNKQLLNDYLGRAKFSYDLDGDALYQQYKDKYIKQGRLAMEDTMGQAAAMTGGYGNSYAQSAGQQAYNAQLDNLNDVSIQLMQMAYDRYNQEGADMRNKLGALDADYTRGYNAEMDKYNIANSNYVNNTNIWNANKESYNTLEQNRITNDFNIWKANNENTANEAIWNRDNQWHDEDMELKKKSLNNSNYSGSNTSGNTGNNGSKPTNNNNNNKPVKTPAGGFTGKTYESAVSYMKSKGVPNGTASGVMTASEWNRRRSSYQTTGQGSEAVKNYSSYQEFLADFVEYAIETYGK